MRRPIQTRLSRMVSARRRPHWRVALSLIILVAAFSTLGYMIVAHLGFWDALYQTAITLSTVGYQDIARVHAEQLEATHPGIVERVVILTVFVIIFGVGVIAYSFSALIHALIEGELREAIGWRRLRRKVRFMKEHFIICGYGRMGEIIAESLTEENIPIVIIESNPEKRRMIEEAGYICLTADATHDETLKEAAIDKARGLITVTNSDPENLFITLSARQLNPRLIIVGRSLSPEGEQKLLRAGANRIILPYKLGAHQIAQAALRPNVVDFIEIATRTSRFDMEMEEVYVPPDSHLAGKELQEATVLRQLGLIVIGIRRAEESQMHFNPSASTAIEPNDTLIVLGKQESLSRIHEYLS